MVEFKLFVIAWRSFNCSHLLLCRLIGKADTSLSPFISVRITPASLPSASSLRISSTRMSTLQGQSAFQSSMRIAAGDLLLLWSKSLLEFRTCLISPTRLTLLRLMVITFSSRIQLSTRGVFGRRQSSIPHWSERKEGLASVMIHALHIRIVIGSRSKMNASCIYGVRRSKTRKRVPWEVFIVCHCRDLRSVLVVIGFHNGDTWTVRSACFVG